MKIVISEKPSVARDIARVLKATQKKDGYFEGSGYQITWALGHLIQLVYPENYDQKYKLWKMSDLPIIPTVFKTELVKNKGAQKQFDTIKKLLQHQSATDVICATDAGREGELIFRLIYQYAQSSLPIQRLWISSQTDQAIRQGFDTLQSGDDYFPLFDSALSRSEADWLIGINASRAYTILFSRGDGVMSVGRVQTPVLKMIVDRYLTNTNFKPETFYEIFSDISHANGDYMGKWFHKKQDRFFDKAKAEDIHQMVMANPSGIIKNLTQKTKREQQPLLYDLTELQKDANKRFKFSADKTLKILQQLYESHKVLTYPRTSSRYLSQDMVPKLDQLIQNLSDSDTYKSFVTTLTKQKLTVTKRIVDDKKVTDHHAIIPTDKKANPSQFTPDELKIYDLVIKRFLCVFMAVCLKDHTEIISLFGDHLFKTTGIVMKSPGWRSVYLQESLQQKEESLLPTVQKNDPIQLKECRLVTGQTKPPPLYNEASILAAMETAGRQVDDDELKEAMKDCGLGTPATRAQIIERLISVNYIKREKHKLIPTPKGQQLISVIQSESLLSPELTGSFEKKLLDMTLKKFKRETYMNEIKTFTKEIVTQLDDSNLKKDSDLKIGDCPKCDGTIIVTPKGFGCSNWKETQCDFIIWRSVAGHELSDEDAKALLEEGKTKVIKGFKSKEGKPFEASLVLKEGNVVFDFNAEPIGKCPLCKGDVVGTMKAFSCSKWRETGCSFAIWKKIAGRDISEVEAKQLINDGKTTLLSGFVSRAGNAFDTTLVLNNGKVEFQF